MTPTRAFRIPNVLMERVDAARGTQSRTAFVVAALEHWLIWLSGGPDPSSVRFDEVPREPRPAGAKMIREAKERLGLTREPPVNEEFGPLDPHRLRTLSPGPGTAEIKAGVRPVA